MCVSELFLALQTADLANADASEADKLTAVMHQSTEGYDPSQ